MRLVISSNKSNPFLLLMYAQKKENGVLEW